MKNTTELANFALMALGMGQIQSLSDGGNSATLCSTWHSHATRTTLAQGKYLSTIRRTEMTSVGGSDDGWLYRYTRPEKCLKILAILTSRDAEETDADWASEGQYILSDVPGAWLKYVAAPNDISELDDLVAEAVGFKLAMLVGPGLGMDQDNPTLREVERKFNVADGAARSVNEQNRSRKKRTRKWTQAGRS